MLKLRTSYKFKSFISDSQTAFHLVEKVACVYYYLSLGEQFQRIPLHETLNSGTASVRRSQVTDLYLKAAPPLHKRTNTCPKAVTRACDGCWIKESRDRYLPTAELKFQFSLVLEFDY